ncbi:MAG: TIGR03016 family PEP-CTERM system-associated outer membrane protein [Ectothiorhodospiraceae bacterium]|nr:TIGR03016 family PEP-CTERM system-associated outer membrane protein [Chromatiales bacterium]MCP5157215.1 TIGR03016 family PEP-CTERM system-associated outer membrane protein [Ectothiorhodospiraceae bacterium]
MSLPTKPHRVDVLLVPRGLGVVRACVLLGLATTPFTSAVAGDWTFTPRLSVSETFSDNIGLDPSGQAEHEFVTDVSPGISLRGTGSRLDVNLIYNLQALHYARGTDPSQINHQLQASGTGEVWEDIGFLDVRSTIRQANSAGGARQASSTRSATGTLDDVMTLSVSPYVRKRFGRDAKGEARYRYATVEDSGTSGTTDTHEFSLNVSSGERFARVPWSVAASHREEDDGSGTSSTFQEITGTLSYKFSRAYAANASVGYESNDFTTSRGDTSGLTLSASGTWTPTPRTSVELGMTDKFSGNSFFARASHRSRRAVFSLRYGEEVTTSSRLELEREFIALVDPFGEPILDPDSGQAIVVPIETPRFTNEVIVQKRLEGSMAFQGRRTNASVRVFSNDRDFEASGASEKVYGISANASRTLSRATSASLRSSWQRTEPQGGLESTRWSVGAGVSRTFSRDLRGSLDVGHTRQSSDNPADEFTENRVSLQLSMSF